MDGVLTDTVEYHYQSWQQLAAELQINFTRKDNEKLLGLSRPDSMKIFLQGRHTTPAKFAQLLQQKNEYFLKLIQNFGPQDLLPGVANLLTTLKRAGYKLAVASSSRNAPFILNRLEIVPFFDAITDSNSISRAKPAPDLFLNAAKRLAVPPEQCVVFEDSSAGVLAGLASEMLVVGIGPAELVGKAHVRFDSMSTVELNKILTYKKIG